MYQIIGLSYAVVAAITLGVLGWEWSKSKSFDLANLPLTGNLVLLSRILIGALFFYSGFVKANDYIGFGYKLEEYFLTFASAWPWTAWFWNFWEPLAAPLAWFISVFEIALAVAIIVGWRMNLTAWLSMLMMVFFTVLTGYSAVTGSVTDCGCFGDALKIEPWESFVKDIILTSMLLPLFLVRKSVKPFPGARIAGILTAASFVIAGGYSYWCHEHLPAIDYRAYKVGVDLDVCTSEIPAGADFPKCKDWGPGFMGDYEPDFFSGTKMMIVAYDLKKSSDDGLSALPGLAQGYHGAGVETVMLTSSLPDATAAVVEKYHLPFTVGFMDGTALKTIVRSNPGYVLLENGIIKGKWHYNDAPDAAEVNKALGR
ncbi:MAG: DoxX family membrane protein [Bacteroidia bacterium]|nr:DoxX family membrane protein [Bacteroidia bacterium]